MFEDANPCGAVGLFWAFASAGAVIIAAGAIYRHGLETGLRRGFAAGVERAALTFRRIIDAANAREFFPPGTVRNASADILGIPRPKLKPKPKPKRAGGK
jgi:hypothetical protein